MELGGNALRGIIKHMFGNGKQEIASLFLNEEPEKKILHVKGKCSILLAIMIAR
jgi:hypothetical protein